MPALKHASENEILNVKFINEIWPNYLVNSSFAEFYKNLEKTGFWLLLILPFIYYLIVYFFRFMVEIAFRFLHYFLMAITILLKASFIFLKLILHYPVKITIIAFNWFYNAVEKGYPNVLDWSLNNKSKVIGSVTALFAFTIIILGPQIGSELIPEVHQGNQLNGQYRA